MKYIKTFALLLLIKSSLAQDSLQYRVFFTPSYLIFNELRVGIDIQKNRNMLSLGFAYRPDTDGGGELDGICIGMCEDYWFQKPANFFYKMFFTSISYKIFPKTMNHTYYEAQLFYKHWWFEDKYVKYDGNVGYGFDGLRDERENVFGLKILMGYIKYWRNDKKLKPFIDVYGGIGIRYKDMSYFTHQGTVNEVYYENYQENFSFIMPSIHINFRTGIAF